MITHVDENLPQEELPVFVRFPDRPGEQHLIVQLDKITAHPALDVIPVDADGFAVVGVCGRQLIQRLDALQLAEPGLIAADQVNDLVADRPAGVIDIPGELLPGQLPGRLPYLEVFAKVVLVQMVEGFCIHRYSLLSVGSGRL